MHQGWGLSYFISNAFQKHNKKIKKNLPSFIDYSRPVWYLCKSESKKSWMISSVLLSLLEYIARFSLPSLDDITLSFIVR